MGTRGLRVYRLNKRYYALFNHWDSYPSGLGKEIVAEIPSTPAEYQAWLASVRAMITEWEAEYEKFLSIGPNNEIHHPEVDVPAKQDDSDDGEAGDENTSEASEPKKQQPEWMQHQLPSYFTPMNDTWIEWIYTMVGPTHSDCDIYSNKATSGMITQADGLK